MLCSVDRLDSYNHALSSSGRDETYALNCPVEPTPSEVLTRSVDWHALREPDAVVNRKSCPKTFSTTADVASGAALSVTGAALL